MEPHDGIRVVGPPGERYDEVLTPEALTFLHHLHNTFEERRHDRLAAREERRARVAAGDDPTFLPKPSTFGKTRIGVSLPQLQAWRTVVSR